MKKLSAIIFAIIYACCAQGQIIKNVGAGEQFTSLTNPGGLFEYLNDTSVHGNIKAVITTDLPGETGQIVLRRRSLYDSLMIVPSDAQIKTITGNTDSGMVKLYAARNVIIDGAWAGSGKYLHFVNYSDTSKNSAAIALFADKYRTIYCNNIIIKNTVIRATNTAHLYKSTIVTKTQHGIFSGGQFIGDPGSGNSRIIISNNEIPLADNGITFFGNSSVSVKNSYITISGNVIGADSIYRSGIYISYSDSSSIRYNKIANIVSHNSSAYGIIANDHNNNLVINANSINRVESIIEQPQNTSPGNAYIGNACGIYVNTPFYSGSVTLGITNNFVANIAAGIYNYDTLTTHAMVQGIAVERKQPNVTYQVAILNNSIYIAGTHTDGAGNTESNRTVEVRGISTNLAVNYNPTVPLLNVQDNLITLKYNAASSPVVNYGNFYAGTNPYRKGIAMRGNIYDLGTNNQYTTFLLGKFLNDTCSDRKKWFQYASEKTGAAIPQYANTSIGDLHLTGGSIGDYALRGISKLITTDIDGEQRKNLTPQYYKAYYCGADEILSAPLSWYLSPVFDTVFSCPANTITGGQNTYISNPNYNPGTYSYEWVNGGVVIDSQQTLTGPTNGTYIYRLKDSLGFTSIDTFTNSTYTSIKDSIYGPATVCQGDTFLLTAKNKNAGVYNWFSILGYSSSVSIVKNLGDSIYLYIRPGIDSIAPVLLTEINGQCYTTATFPLNINSPRNSKISSQYSSACINSTHIYNFTTDQTSLPITNIKWDVDTGLATILSGQNTISVSVKWKSATPNAKVTISYEYNGCHASDIFMLQVVDTPTAIINPLTLASLCYNDSNKVILSTTPDMKYQWSNGTTTQKDTISIAGTYTVTVTSAPNCSIVSAPFVVERSAQIPRTIDLTYRCGTSHATLTAASGPNYGYKWSTLSTLKNTDVYVTNRYYVTITDGKGCKDTISKFVPISPISLIQEICSVSYDDSTGKNIITWNRNPDPSIDTFQLISSLGFQYHSSSIDADLFTTYIDTFINADMDSGIYYMRLQDSCKNISLGSVKHTSMFLKARTDPQGNNIVTWNFYRGFTYPEFKIYRGPDRYSLPLLAQNPPEVNFYIDTNPLPGNNFYRVEVESPQACTPSLRNNYGSLSNIASIITIPLNIQQQMAALHASVFPNPVQDIITLAIDLPAEGTKDWSITLADLQGRIIMKSTNVSCKNRFDMQTLSTGMYVLKLATNAGLKEWKVIR